MVTLFPGRGPNSLCQDLGDVPPAALETAFDLPIEVWKELLLRSRTLLFSDWQSTQEIADVVRALKPLPQGANTAAPAAP